MTGLGSKSLYSSATQDCANKVAVARTSTASRSRSRSRSLDTRKCLFIIARNPFVSKWSFLQVSNPGQRLKEIQARGGRVVVIDPAAYRRLRARERWVPIRPGSDVFFFLSFLHELFAQGGVDPRARRAAHERRRPGGETRLRVAAERTEAVTRSAPEAA